MSRGEDFCRSAAARIFWAWAWSIVGMLIAVPLLVTLRAFSEHVPQLAPLGDFLSARKAEREPAEGDAPRR